MIPWIKKYSPKVPKELLVSSKLADYINTYTKQKKKAILLYGSSGTGKTSAVYAFPGYEVVEVNASDNRNKDALEQLLGNAIAQKSLFGQNKLILIDDVDGISGKDRGAVQAIIKIIASSTFPVVITCQDPFTQKLSSLRSKCVLLECPKFLDSVIISVLEDILKKEEVSYSTDDLKIIAENSQGDLRAAINDIQLLTVNKTLQLPDVLTQRMQKKEIKEALLTLFKKNPALDTFDAVSEDFDQIQLWIDYNLPLEYKEPQARARAYGCLTKADVFMRRIKRRQHWRFLVHVNALLSAGVSSSKERVNPLSISYTQTTRLLQIWQANRKYAIRKSISEKIARAIHTSTKRVISDFVFYVHIAKVYDLGLDDAELEFLKKTYSI